MPNDRGATFLTISFLGKLVHAPDSAAVFAIAAPVDWVSLGGPVLVPFPIPRIHWGLRD